MTVKPENAAFAERLGIACDEHPSVPPLYKGRLTWVQDRLLEEGDEFTLESVRRWFNGAVRPRHPTVIKLAKILNVDLAWLATGSTNQPTISERRKVILSASGAVNIVAGLLQSAGFLATFPEDDRTSNLHATVGGKRYTFCVAPVVENNRKLTVTFSEDITSDVILLAVDVDPKELTAAVYEVPQEIILEKGDLYQGQASVALADLPTSSLGQLVQRLRR